MDAGERYHNQGTIPPFGTGNDRSRDIYLPTLNRVTGQERVDIRRHEACPTHKVLTEVRFETGSSWIRITPLLLITPLSLHCQHTYDDSFESTKGRRALLGSPHFALWYVLFGILKLSSD